MSKTSRREILISGASFMKSLTCALSPSVRLQASGRQVLGIALEVCLPTYPSKQIHTVLFTAYK
jgi:hypothetical protein